LHLCIAGDLPVLRITPIQAGVPQQHKGEVVLNGFTEIVDHLGAQVGVTVALLVLF
jgi:hypothetical protein